MSNTQSPTRVKLNNVRITFPELFEPKEYKPGDGKGFFYSASFILPRDHPGIPALRAAIQAAAVAKWQNKADEMLAVAKAKDKLPVHDGDLKANKPYGAAYKGMLYVSARNKVTPQNLPPRVFALEQDPATGLAREIKAIEGRPHSGEYVNVILDIFGYVQGGGEGVGASIAGVQSLNHGERLAGGATASADDFDAVPVQQQEAAASSGKGAAALF